MLRIVMVAEKAGTGEIRLTDMKGRLSTIVWRGPIALGANSLRIPALGLSPGVYLARIAAPDRVECRKVLIKN